MNVSGIKEIRVQMTKAEREFRELFRELGKKYGLSMHSRSSIYENRDDMIEIWREEGGKTEIISRVKRKDIEECYEIAVVDLKFYDERKQRTGKHPPVLQGGRHG